MLIHDKIYGDIDISSPVVCALIQTKAFQRLKDISQFGIPDQYSHNRGYSRYEHSLGVYFLLNKLKASEEQQIAGLLHDLSHTAFSHVVDWVIDNVSNENFQDKSHVDIVNKGEIAEILTQHNYNPSQIANLQAFPLLEREVPDLCADRIDYALREISKPVIEACLPALIVHNNEIIFNSIDTASIFAHSFLDIQINHWAGYEAITRYSIFSQLLKDAMGAGVISFADLWETEEGVIHKINKSNTKKYQEILDLLTQKDLSFLPKSKNPIMKKLRYVDPKIQTNNGVLRLSEINPTFKLTINKAIKQNKHGYHSGLLPI